MKKILLTAVSGIVGVLAIAQPAFAATNVTFTPTTVSVREGQSFTVRIAVDPQGVKNYTAKAEVRFPSDLVSVSSFSLANNWTPFSQPGYDLVDNTNGVLIKTGGYPGGLLASANFGTISFVAKKTGTATISLHSNSLMLDAGNQNVLGGALAQSVVTISAPVAQTTPTTQTNPKVTSGENTTITTPEGEVSAEVAPVDGDKTNTETEPAQDASTLTASVGNILTLGTGNKVLGVVVLAVLLYGIYALVQRMRRKDVVNSQ